MLAKELAGRDGVPRDSLRGFGTVRQSRRIAEIKIFRVRRLAYQLLQYGQTADARIKDADLHCIAFTSACTSVTVYVPIRSACPESVSRSLPSTIIFTFVICGTLAASV